MTGWRKYTRELQAALYDPTADELTLDEAIFCAGLDRVYEDKPRIEELLRTHPSEEIQVRAIGTLVGSFRDEAWVPAAFSALQSREHYRAASNALTIYSRVTGTLKDRILKEASQACLRLRRGPDDPLALEWAQDLYAFSIGRFFGTSVSAHTAWTAVEAFARGFSVVRP